MAIEENIEQEKWQAEKKMDGSNKDRSEEVKPLRGFGITETQQGEGFDGDDDDTRLDQCEPILPVP